MKIPILVEIGFRNNRIDIISSGKFHNKIWNETWIVNDDSIEADAQKIIDDWNQNLKFEHPGELPRKIIRIITDDEIITV